MRINNESHFQYQIFVLLAEIIDYLSKTIILKAKNHWSIDLFLQNKYIKLIICLNTCPGCGERLSFPSEKDGHRH